MSDVNRINALETVDSEGVKWNVSTSFKLLKCLFAAGDVAMRSLENFPADTKKDIEAESATSLKSSCRDVIRKHLLQMSRLHLFIMVPKTGRPKALQKYLLY